MPDESIPTTIVSVALEYAEGAAFERFANEFFPAVTGSSFVPLGGHKDGGADAYDEGIYERVGQPDHFFQASVEKDVEGKVRRTVARLREFGRSPKRLTYLSSQIVRYVDKVEDKLTEDLDVTVTIRDGSYFRSHVNDGPQTRRAFNDHLRHYTDFLKAVGAGNLISVSEHVRSPAVYVYLGQELDRRDGGESLLDAVTDSLGMWGLEGTDPDQGILRTAAEVGDRIGDEVPSVLPLVEPRLYGRLRALARKDREDGRSVKWHREPDAFCLPYETRLSIEEENAADEALRLEVLATFRRRAEATPHVGVGAVGLDDTAAVALRSLQITFEREGLEFASFLHDEEATGNYATITDSIKAAMAELGITGRRCLSIGPLAFEVLRRTFYHSEPCERDYLEKLSKMYALLFTLNSEPRLVRYFEEMTGRFQLYVGTDLLITALSEHCLAEADQVTRNTLLMAYRQGAQLILTAPALEEVISHLRACDAEYKNWIQPNEGSLTYEQAREAPHIILRAYLYSRLAPAEGAKYTPHSWEAFIHQFCDYPGLKSAAAETDLRRYLQSTFGMTFATRNELEEMTDPAAVKRIAESLRSQKRDNMRLARNDALVALAVYGNRRRRGETSSTSEFGFESWWLTGETNILKYTSGLESRHGARYIMRPDFLLKFLALAPNAAEARAAFANVFPSLLGIQMSRRMDQRSFHKLMKRTQTAGELEHARRTAAMARIADQLKSDFDKVFVPTVSESHSDED